jgi:hypothetical protein
VAVGFVYASTFISPAIAADKPATIPDFSGIWGRNWFHFEPPPSGTGPIVSKLRNPDGTMYGGDIGDDTASILKPEAAEAVKKVGEIELSGRVSPNPHGQCWPEPTPFLFTVQLGMQVLQQKDEVILLYLSDNQVRHVRMNVPHPARVAPTWKGDSVGHYEGDTLVVDTIGQKIGPFSMVDRYGTPYGPALHVIERYRLIDGAAASTAARKHESSYGVNSDSIPDLRAPIGRREIDPDTKHKGLQIEITVEDSRMFTASWSGLVTYRKVLGDIGDWPEAVCAENTREFGPERKLPIDDTPDF